MGGSRECIEAVLTEDSIEVFEIVGGALQTSVAIPSIPNDNISLRMTRAQRPSRPDKLERDGRGGATRYDQIVITSVRCPPMRQLLTWGFFLRFSAFSPVRGTKRRRMEPQ